MHASSWLRLTGLSALAVLVACSVSNNDNNQYNNRSVGNPGGTQDAAPPPANSTDADLQEEAPTWDTSANTDPDASGTSSCNTDPDEDFDNDGYSVNQGDCNDCDPNANPGAFDIIGGVDGGVGVDEDCDGIVDNEVIDCDQGFDIDDKDAMNAAKSLGLCRTTTANAQGKDKTWGVISAKYVKADGSNGMDPLSHGIVPRFGAAGVQEGMSMVVLSSGTARAHGQKGFESPEDAQMGTSSNPPPGYPKDSTSCDNVFTGDEDCNDPAALELEIRVPTNAHSFSFNFNFYTYEYPSFICSRYNDFFVTLLDPKPKNLPDGNISFDQDGNPISVNNSLLQVCKPQTAGGKAFPCPLGTTLLGGTGFDEPARNGPHAATGWLQTKAPVEPGTIITLRFAIWDTADHILDSTVLIDNFQWSVEPATAAETKPIDTPK